MRGGGWPGVCSWGYNVDGELGNGTSTGALVPVAVDPSGVLAGKNIAALSVGYLHSCAVADGRGYCWGRNTEGQLGNNSTTNSSVPVPVSTSGVLAGKTIGAISAGAKHTCAVAEGRAYCWGNNDNGKLGDDRHHTADSKVPVAVDISGVLAQLASIIAVSGWGTNTPARCPMAWPTAGATTATENWGPSGVGSSSKVPVAVDTSGVLARQDDRGR